jgi:hypothetical protein
LFEQVVKFIYIKRLKLTQHFPRALFTGSKKRQVGLKQGWPTFLVEGQNGH